MYYSGIEFQEPSTNLSELSAQLPLFAIPVMFSDVVVSPSPSESSTSSDSVAKEQQVSDSLDSNSSSSSDPEAVPPTQQEATIATVAETITTTQLTSQLQASLPIQLATATATLPQTTTGFSMQPLFQYNYNSTSFPLLQTTTVAVPFPYSR
jgi:hypothetical protein